MRVSMPSGAALIIKRLESQGYRADIVGGCVRDAALGRRADDYDITTSASPETVVGIFSDLRVIETGIAHGTVTVIADGSPYEVTAYRIDGEYTDGRHPDSVMFTSRIEDDLSRRDFTVNAMAYSDTHGLTDLFGGMRDLECGVIRAVGDPFKRFTEDALRILRAIRFASVLGFEIEEETSRALRALAPHLDAVSKERIYTEWHKLLGGRAAYDVILEYRDVIAVFLPELSELSMPPRESFESVGAEARFAALFYATLKERAADAFHVATLRLKTDKKTRETGALALKSIDRQLAMRTDAVRLLSELGEDVARLVFDVRAALGIPTYGDASLVDLIRNDGTVYKISDLKVSGNDLVSLGISGREIGKTLSALLGLVISGKILNEKGTLLAAAKTFMQ